MHTPQFNHFLDPSSTVLDSETQMLEGLHVRTMDCNIICNQALRQVISKGLNHIPRRPTNIPLAMEALVQAFENLYDIFSDAGSL